MPHNNSYKVTKDLPPTPLQNVVALPTRNHIHQDIHIHKEKKCGDNFSCSWVSACIFGVFCMTVLFYIIFGAPPEIFPRQINLYSQNIYLEKKGHLQIYPDMYNEEALRFLRVRNVYNILVDSSTIDNKIVPSMQRILDEYPEIEAEKVEENYVHCWLENPSFNKPCYFDRVWLGHQCTKENSFGYQSVNQTFNPCFIVRLEETQGWRPTMFSIKEHNETWLRSYDPGFFGVSCFPLSRLNSKILRIRQYPRKGFSRLYFPESRFRSDIYRSPLLMMQLLDVKEEENVTIQCWLHAKNAFMLSDSGKVTITFSHADSTISGP